MSDRSPLDLQNNFTLLGISAFRQHRLCEPRRSLINASLFNVIDVLAVETES